MVKKKIAIIGLKGLPPFGGAANVGDNIIEQLAGEYEFTVYATASHTSHKGDYKGARQIVFARFPIKSLNIFYYYIASAVHAVFSRNYDMVHLHQMDGAFTLLLLRLKYKVIATSHGLTYRHGKWSRLFYPYFKLNEWFQARLSNHLTVVSKSLVPHYARLIPTEKISYIPNGVTPVMPVTPVTPVTPSTPSTENPGAIPPAPSTKDPDVTGYILFAAGRIIPTKGLHFLLSALQQCGYKGRLIVLGDHSQLKDYSQQLFTLAAGLDIEFKGLIKDKALLNAWIAGARLFVFPSTYEAMSMMLLEVAALGTPVICSDIVENTDIFDRDEMLFFRSASDTDLAARLDWAFSHPEEMKVFAAKARQTLLTKYQWPMIGRQYKGLFERIMTDKKPKNHSI
jgi:glycosyltransferase involved in cell wall biosynthesis